MTPASSALKASANSEVTEIPMLIGGEWRAAAESYDVRDPYRGTVVAHAPRSTLGDLDECAQRRSPGESEGRSDPCLRTGSAVAPCR